MFIWICPKIADIPKSNGCHAYCTWGYLRIYIGIYSNMACNMGEYRINSKPVAMLKIQLSASHIQTLVPLFPLVPPLTTCIKNTVFSRSCSSAHDTLALRHVIGFSTCDQVTSPNWGCGTPCLTHHGIRSMENRSI
jgi:hypothetical protein